MIHFASNSHRAIALLFLVQCVGNSLLVGTRGDLAALVIDIPQEDGAAMNGLIALSGVERARAQRAPGDTGH